ncbi:hypothetical protein BUL40_08370 [Croceivirga radicis]|uniref:PKD domain-containing protein n=1 Tax=Croceivirga radicis TaxID=1929488 RepID=A0A1V6LSD6_9FLAO|nr:PKD domain-containing protein [Croceivirga radicis]OQD43094.1 hypothetical protein BUL40_08370 [Croceivirga radicis]
MKKNYKLLKKPNWLLGIGIAFAFALSTGFGPLFFGPGITDAEPIGGFLNNSFPNVGAVQTPYQVAYPGVKFDSPIKYVTVPNQNRVVVGQLDGRIFWMVDDQTTTTKTEVVDFSAEVGDHTNGEVWDGGFLGLAIHPQFGTAGKNYFYIYYTTAEPGNTLGSPQGFSCGLERYFGNFLILERFEVDPTSMTFLPGSRQQMIKRRMYNTTHRGGDMVFGNDGYLYITTGDQATYRNAQDIAENLDGGVLRLDIDMNPLSSHTPIRTLASSGAGELDEFSGRYYFIPNDNPFPSPTGDTFEEYFSLGHRNPHRISKDSDTGTMYIGEVGENTHEEVNILESGKNYGWPFFEGDAVFNVDSNCISQMYNNMPHQGPLTSFAPDDANSIIGGYVYRGSEIPDLQGKYICADYGDGDEIFSIDIATGIYEIIGNFSPADVISFGQGYDNELYLLKYGNDVNLYKLTTPGISYTGMPQNLSDTGAFSDLGTLEVNPGIIPYEMIDPFWSDGATKKRWMAIPNDGAHDTAAEQIQFSENGVWDFPVGSVLIKHFDYPIDERDPTITRKVETRFSIKGQDGNFYFLTYRWLPDESDAVLQEIGRDEPIQVTTLTGGTKTETWHYPSNSECISCHNPALGGTLGPRTRFLNKDYDYSEKGGVVGNQLVTLSHLGILNETITDTDTPNFLTHTSINDNAASLEEKARSYLDLNCAYCHQPATGNRADFDLRLVNTLAQTGLLNADILTPLGVDAEERILYPSDANKSILYHRTNSVDPSIMMPPLAKGKIDEAGVALLEAWINQLAPQAELPDFGLYRLVNVETGGTLQVEDGIGTNEGNIDQGAYQVLDSQHFELENATGGYYQFKADHSNRYLDVASSNTNPGANVWQYAGNGTDAQLWQLVDAGNDSYYIISKLSGYFLGVQPDGNVAVIPDDGSDIVKWQFREPGNLSGRDIVLNKEIVSTSENGSAAEFTVVLASAPSVDISVDIQAVLNTDEIDLSTNQITFTTFDWDVPQTITITGLDDTDVDGPQPYEILVKVSSPSADPDYEGFSKILEGTNSDDDGGGIAPPDPGTYRIVNVSSGLTMELLGATIDDFGNVQQGSYEQASHEQFELIYIGNGQYNLQAVHSGKVVDVANSSTNAGANVIQYRNNGTNAQKWTIVDAGFNSYHIISVLSGYYLGIDATGNIIVDNEDGTDIYRWQFVDPSLTSLAGITANKDQLFTDEDGQSETFAVVLDQEPTDNVTIGVAITGDADEINLSTTTLVFSPTNWNIPQEITVTGEDDLLVDGVREYFIELTTIAPLIDPNYTGIGTTLNGRNLDNDGGDNGPPREGEYRLVNVETGETIRAEAAGTANETNFISGGYDGSNYQHFALEYDGNDLYKLRALHSDKYFDVQFSDTSVGANVWQYTGNNSNAQKWKLVYAGENMYHIISELSGYYVTIGAGGNIEIAEDNGTDIYKWQFLATGFAPEAIATADILAGNTPLAVQFTGSNSTDDKNDIVTYHWDFGNGDISNEINPLYTYVDAGVFEVSLSVTDGDGYSNTSAPQTVTVNGTPVAIASADITSGDAPLSINFIGSNSTDDVGIVSYAWNFGDGSISNEQNPSYTYTTPGEYTATLVVTDANSATDMAEITITVNGTPNAVISADVLAGNPPLTVNFIGSNSTDDQGIVNYLWDFGDGDTSSEADPTHIFANQGIYTVVLTVTDDFGSTSTAELTITVNSNPIAIATSDITTGEAPLMVNFTGSNSTDDVEIVDYLWDFGDGNSSTEVNPSHSFITAGEYTVVLTVTDGEGLTDTAELIILVTEPENMAPVAVSNADVTSGEAPLMVNFTGSNSTDDVEIVDYLWDFGDGNISTEVNPSHSFITAGEYTVVLKVTDGEGLTDTAELIILVTEPENMAPVAVSSADVTSGEAPLMVNFTGSNSTDDVEIVDYLWDFGDGNSSTEVNPSHSFTMAGEYTVVLTVTDAAGLIGTTELIITVIDPVNTAPVAVASSNVSEGETPLTVLFTGDNSIDDVSIAKYEWNFGDGGTSSEVNPSYVFNEVGTYNVTLTVTDGEGLNDIAELTIVVLENETNSVDEAKFIISPNPASEGNTTLYVNDLQDDFYITRFLLHDGAGRLLGNYDPAQLFRNDNEYTVPISRLRNEIYYLTIMFNNREPVVKRILVDN